MATRDFNKLPSIPSYPEMILKAIEALNEENGSNKSSISKHLESTWGGLPQGHKALLNVHLAKMRDSGELVFWKNNYAKRDPNAPPRRGRGRPPKSKDPLPPDTVVSSPKPRGRPPKYPNEPPRPPKVKTRNGSGRPRGRPKKIARSTGGFGGVPIVSVAAGSGRPPKMKAPFTEISV
ncbi:unnamed protein product [Lupinus luteus]|uniref:H15 domain-containing protein n=1 Tax=Lupinus luteus TaxID=3873 RepID=A0AAV1YPK2_LUPLU